MTKIPLAVLQRLLASIVVLLPVADPAAEEQYLHIRQSFYASVDSGGDLAGNRLDNQAFDIDASLWRLERGGTQVEVRFRHAYIEFDFATPPSVNLDPHDLRFPVLVRRRFSGWHVEGFVAPGVATSSNVLREFDFSGDDFNVNAGITASIDVGRDFSWVVGARIDRRFGSTTLYPTIGIDGAPAPGWRLYAVLPDLALDHCVSPRFGWGVRVEPAGNRWQIFDDEANRRFTLRARAWRAGLTTGYALRDGIWMTVGAATEWGRALRSEDFAGTTLSARPSDTVRFSIGFALGIGRARVPTRQANAIFCPRPS